MAETYLDYPRAPRHQKDGDPIGVREMVELTGRGIKAVYKWHERGSLPLADGPRVNGYPTWRRRTFLAWAYDNFFTRDPKTNEPLPIHAEAEACAEKVSSDAIRSLRDLRPQESRAG